MPPPDPFEAGLIELLPRLRRFARSLTRDPADADDLVQQGLEKAWRARAQWAAGTRLDHWLMQILRNGWIDQLRSAERRRAREEEYGGGSPGVADLRAEAESAIDLQRVLGALDRLPPEQREVVALILVEGLGYREAAELLDLPIGTVSSRLVRGRNALLEMIGD